MKKHNPENERIKRQYFAYLKEAKRHSESTVDAVAKAMSRFETYTAYRGFKAFHFQQAVSFKRSLSEQLGVTSGERLSKATLYATLNQLKRFFQWLAGQPGYKSKFSYCDADYFNISDKDARIATARRERTPATLAQIRHVLDTMPSDAEIDRRNRALVAFTLLTGARDRAIASFKLKHVDLNAGCLHQDARDVKTKFSKSFNTFFFPVGEDVRLIFVDWIHYLETEKLWGTDDPLFPATKISLGANRQFGVSGLTRDHWTTASPIRSIFRDAFINAGLPYFHPHSFRHTLVALGMETCQSPEHFKAWSQNLGHEKVLTTFVNYGEVACRRQAELVRELGKPRPANRCGADEIADALLKKIKASGGSLSLPDLQSGPTL